MDTIVFLAVLLAALLHATWNALVKGSAEKHISMASVVLGHVPAAICLFPFIDMPRPESWPYIIAGAVLHTGYQFFLLGAYRVGDFTQVYPLARGSAPLLVALVSIAFLGVALSWGELAAVLIIGCGIISLIFVRNSEGLLNRRAALLALGTGCFIASYSLVDGLGARVAETALGFYAWLTILNAVLFGAIIERLHPGTVRRSVAGEWRLALGGGGASFAAYALAIWAFTQAPIALVTALRETSIVFALLIGVVFLKERLNLIKVLSTAMTLSGAILLRLSR
ncbi:MAG: DMT family transporter [Pseudomonadota bacterium]